MAYPELAHMPGVIGEWAHDVCLGLLGLAIDGIDVVDEEGNLHTAAALPRCEQAGALGFPIWCALCCQLDRGLPARQFSIFVCLAGHNAKAQNVLKPSN